MAFILSYIVYSFRSLSSIFMSAAATTNTMATNCTAIRHLDVPLPPVIHKTLSKEFMDTFAEVVVIGDVHGCYDELLELLDKIKDDKKDGNNSSEEYNNNKRILKLFVGDLVNKGPKSAEVLTYLMSNPLDCQSVRGNHDEVVINEFLRYETDGEQALKPKNKWISQLSRPQVDYLLEMPYTISIPSLNALVVHAGIVPGLDLHRQTLKDMVVMRNLYLDNEENQQQLVATNSDKTGDKWISRWSGPEHIYFGHDAKRGLQRAQLATGLDTGCVYGNSLTALFIAGHRTGTFVSVKARAVHVQPKIKSDL
ncbi:bis(5'-nucleosyl)-tetraphosphatase PrpE [asymmetrical]-like [Oppia nitens]|uniref:bis(5'-nucleosyl)-tetraphosphatase PrpE [asymmetrical]-like n=1 Tax=Oppia nitens TaxID=1686743 RepID=UPI0023DA5950|nr:bis(5'-nucleosyl)-tetraphosphatase PrpE [asymmetrical]-like [Oppia nitens]